ncbi:MAG: S-formylglutathione hydrolase [Proteobacteria bacterium]|nr:S-formylglutathione hydrolase [Pseudomonadota bacterium]
MQLVKSHKTFGGRTSFWTHDSTETHTPMRFSTFEPAGGNVKRCIVWLSGLTCTEENFMTKAGVQSVLANSQTMVIAPDTSPRGLNLPAEHDSYDFGSGAGFYVDATVGDYARHYRMFSYVINEICPIAKDKFGANELIIMGHSMGGHGALVMGLRHPELFTRIVAFAPIVNPCSVPWGLKAFHGYLGEPDSSNSSEIKAKWHTYDACKLLQSGHRHPAPILIYQGTRDEFLGTQLQPEEFSRVARDVGQEHEITWCEGYDHSYYFVQSFLGSAYLAAASRTNRPDSLRS